jgi:hypothetical protein
MRDIKDLAQKNTFYVLVVYFVQDQIVAWALYLLLWKTMKNAEGFNVSVDVV